MRERRREKREERKKQKDRLGERKRIERGRDR